MKPSYLVLTSDATQTCGVEEFARLLAGRMRPRAITHVLGSQWRRFFGTLQNVDAVIFNFPIVGWKRRLVSPFLTALAARASGRAVVVVLHEWLALDWRRRIVLSPVVLLASRICFSAPEIASEFAHTRLSAFVTGRRGQLPVPPNLLPPAALRPSPASEVLREQRQRGRLILGQFGSIYPKKQSTAILHVAAHLLELGHDVGLVFAGSFIKGTDDVERQFFDLARRLSLADRLQVTGYIASEGELFAIFEQIDVFCYLFPEGLTSRRASVLAAALSRRPVVVNAPARSEALAHHGLYRSLLAAHALRFVATNAGIAEFAEAVLKARETEPGGIDFQVEIAAMWRQVIEDIDRA